MTPQEWYNKTIGKSYNTDGAYGYQCWDYFDYFKKELKLSKFSTYCALTGYAGDIWKLRNTNGAANYFDFISPNNIKEGDWLFWNKHVAFYYNGREIGQNQIAPRNTVTSMKLNKTGIIGAFRFKGWTSNKKQGVAEKYKPGLSGKYITTAALNIRTGGSTEYPSLGVLPRGAAVYCSGYYHEEQGKVWLYVYTDLNGKRITGFCINNYLNKEK